MPQYPVKPEGDLFEAVKDTLTGDHTEGRYARNVLGEDAGILEEGLQVEIQNIKAFAAHLKIQAEAVNKLVSALPSAVTSKNAKSAYHALKLLRRALKKAKEETDYAERYAQSAKKSF